MIFYLPLDDRPCNVDFPILLARIAGIPLCVPNDNDIIASWLEEQVKSGRDGIISIERLIFGGLVSSRLPHTSLDEAMSSFKKIEKILMKKQNSLIFAFSVLMRQAPTSFFENSIQIAEVVSKLSSLEYNRQTTGNDSHKKHEHHQEIESLIKQLPEGLWESYLDTRKRNFEINTQSLLITANGLLNFLAIGMDDITQNSLNILERQRLDKLIIQNNIKNKTIILPGTDELGMVLLARLLLAKTGVSPMIGIKYSTPRGANAILRYEPDQLGKVISDQIRCVGAREAFPREISPKEISKGESSDLWLYVNSPEEMQEETMNINTYMNANTNASINVSANTKKELPTSVYKWIKDLNNSITAGEKIALADVSCANGGDPRLMLHLLKQVPVALLYSYAAWNTASNTIGTVLAHAVIRCLADILQLPPTLLHGAGNAHLSFLFSRFLDDWIYQSILRKELNLYIKENSLSNYNLGDSKQEIENMLQNKLLLAAKQLFLQHFSGKEIALGKKLIIIPTALSDVDASFPWNRTFEIRVTPNIIASLQ